MESLEFKEDIYMMGIIKVILNIYIQKQVDIKERRNESNQHDDDEKR